MKFGVFPCISFFFFIAKPAGKFYLPEELILLNCYYLLELNVPAQAYRNAHAALPQIHSAINLEGPRWPKEARPSHSGQAYPSRAANNQYAF